MCLRHFWAPDSSIGRETSRLGEGIVTAQLVTVHKKGALRILLVSVTALQLPSARTLVERILSAYQQLIERAHAHGLRVFGATITPYVGSNYYHPGPLSEADRQVVNQWVRAAGHFDALIDFDAVVRDPAHPDQLLPTLDCGDHLHPSPAGYKAMGEAIPLTVFAR